MKPRGRPPAVGAPDPERKTSPILDSASLGPDELTPDFEPETGVCYFNGRAYGVGEYVCSGDELLHCEERGVWVKKGPCRPA